MLRFSITAAVLVLAAGCAATPESASPPVAAPLAPAPMSGFLRDYSKLKGSPYHRDTLFEQSSRLGSYTQFIIEPITVLAKQIDAGSDREPLDAATSANLARIARDEIINSLKINNQIVEQPGAGVAKIRAAITRIGALPAAVGMPTRLNAASVEVEIVDSVSGERLGAAVENDKVNPADLYDSGANEAMSGRLDLIRLVFTHWSARLNLWLERAKRGE